MTGLHRHRTKQAENYFIELGFIAFFMQLLTPKEVSNIFFIIFKGIFKDI